MYQIVFNVEDKENNLKWSSKTCEDYLVSQKMLSKKEFVLKKIRPDKYKNNDDYKKKLCVFKDYLFQLFSFVNWQIIKRKRIFRKFGVFNNW